MKFKPAIAYFGAIVLPMIGIGLLAERVAHSQGGPARGIRNTRNDAGTYRSEVKIEEKDGYRVITSNGIPDHAPGRFPNAGNPNTIAPQQYQFRVPIDPKPASNPTRALGQPFGVALNGVPFDPGTAELWNNNPRWHYEALSGFFSSRGSLGMDQNQAHVQPNGAYHYHGLPMGFLKARDYEHRMTLVGYAADGYPIYGPYSYTNPDDAKSGLKMLKPGYKLKSGERTGGENGPGGAYDGSFESDFAYVAGSGDLDEFNGRTGVTPEYPQGTYYYVLTDTFPFVPRLYKGTPDASFRRRGPGGPGGFGGPGGQGRPGFGGPGGQGGPGGPGMVANLVPVDTLSEYLALTPEQKTKLEYLTRTMTALRQERFALPNFARLKLTDSQIRKIAEGAQVGDVLTATQKRILEQNRRPDFGGPGGPGGPGGGFGGPGGPPPGGPDGPPDGPPPGGFGGPPDSNP